jgi:carbamoyltransferase
MKEPVTILGLSGGHDANWCIVRDGVLLGAFEKERFTRQRHDAGEVVSLIGPSLRFLGLSPEDIDIVATSDPVYRGTEPGHRRIYGSDYRRLDNWQWQTAECLGRVLRCISVPHHLAHAAYARYTSRFENTAVLTWDGGGDFHNPGAYACTTVSSWRGAKLEWIRRIENADLGSLWSVYSRAIFNDRHAAGKLMGLAALGSDRLVEAVADCFLRRGAGLLDDTVIVEDRWIDLDVDRPPFLDDGRNWELPSVQDLAYAVQAITIQAGLSMARGVQRITGHRYLAIAGGVALNGYLNTAIKRYAGFDDVFIPPAVHDGGIAVGCALFAAHHALDIPYNCSLAPTLDFVGMAYGPETVARAISDSGLQAYRIDREEAEALVVSALATEQIVGWYEGRSEHGPRALGNRSILSSPMDDRIRRRLNRVIKFREPFRPLAPTVLAEDAATYFDISFSSPYMMHIVGARPEAARLAPAAVHVDGTSRLQTVSVHCSLGRIAKSFGRQTSVPIIVNTSLNVRAPIVETPRDAIQTFLQVPLSMLYLEGWLLRRQ